MFASTRPRSTTTRGCRGRPGAPGTSGRRRWVTRRSASSRPSGRATTASAARRAGRRGGRPRRPAADSARASDPSPPAGSPANRPADRAGRPGRSRTSADARATISPNEKWASDHRPRDCLDTVGLGGHRQVRAGRAGRPARHDSSGVTSHGPKVVAKSLPLAGPSRTDGLLALEIAGRPVVEARVAADRLLAAFGAAGRRPACRSARRPPARSRAPPRPPAPRPGRRARGSPRRSEVEDRQAIPRLRHVPAPALPHRPDVALERVEVAERRRAQDRRAEAQVVDSVASSSSRPRTRPEALDEVAEASTRSPAASRSSSVVIGCRWSAQLWARMGSPRSHGAARSRGRASRRAARPAAPPRAATALRPERFDRGHGRASSARV